MSLRCRCSAFFIVMLLSQTIDVVASDTSEYQVLRWADLLRVEDKTLDSKGVAVFYRCIRDSIATDKRPD